MVPLEHCPLENCPVDPFLRGEVEGPLDCCWILLLPFRYNYLLSLILRGEGEVAPVVECQGKDFVQGEVEEHPNEHYPHH